MLDAISTLQEDSVMGSDLKKVTRASKDIARGGVDPTSDNRKKLRSDSEDVFQAL